MTEVAGRKREMSKQSMREETERLVKEAMEHLLSVFALAHGERRRQGLRW